MKKPIHTALLLSFFLFTLNASKCSENKKLEKDPPVNIGQAYFQKWIAGVEGGGSGIDIFIPVDKTQIQFDSVYFRGMVAKLQEDHVYKNLLVGRFLTDSNTKKDMVMSNEENAEFGNELPKIQNQSPFSIKDDESIISYTMDGEVKYFKINEIVEKQSTGMQSPAPNNNN